MDSFVWEWKIAVLQGFDLMGHSPIQLNLLQMIELLPSSKETNTPQ